MVQVDERTAILYLCRCVYYHNAGKIQLLIDFVVVVVVVFLQWQRFFTQIIRHDGGVSITKIFMK